jgi:transcriptional regulator with XRE-family HTH domain
MLTLKKLRTERGLSQAKLSFLTEINQSTLSRLERGELRLWPGWRRKLAAALSVSEHELIASEENANK